MVGYYYKYTCAAYDCFCAAWSHLMNYSFYFSLIFIYSYLLFTLLLMLICAVFTLVFFFRFDFVKNILFNILILFSNYVLNFLFVSICF